MGFVYGRVGNLMEKTMGAWGEDRRHHINFDDD